MTVKVLYFARLRDELDCAQETLENLPAQCSLGQLKALLAARNELWQRVFSDNQVLAAVNQAMATNETPIQAGDEVGFFPPVTGG